MIPSSMRWNIPLGGSKQFPALSETQILMGNNYHSLSTDTTIMVSKTAKALVNSLVLFS